MRKFALLLLSIFSFAGIAHGQATTAISASYIQGLNGGLLASGSFCLQATDQNNNNVGVQVSGGGIVITTPFCTSVTAGVVSSFNVPNPSTATPLNVRYRITINQGSRNVGTYPNVYLCAASGACTSPYTFSFDTCLSTGACNSNPLPIATGPVGPQGPSGAGGGTNLQSGTTYTAGSGDCGKNIAFSSASAATLTLPSTPPSSTCSYFIQAIGAGGVTINRNGNKIDTASSNLSLTQNQGVYLSTNGTDWFTERGVGGSSSGSAGGDLSGSYPNPTVAQVNGAAIPASQNLLGSNSSHQLVAGTAIVPWQKWGPVVSGGSVDAQVVQEPTVFITPTPQVLTTGPSDGAQVLGMLYTLGFTSPSLGYMESLDGVNWTPSTSISISGHAHTCEAYVGSTLYWLAANAPSGTNGIDIFSGADAGHMSLLKANIVTSGGGHAWKALSLANCGFWHDLDTHYYLLYEGQYGSGWSIGLADCGTSTPSSGMTCTDYASNPVIGSASSGSISDPKSIRQISSNSYITWLHGTPGGATASLPSDAYFAYASSPHGPWTVSSDSVLFRTNQTEGVNTTVGQLADISAVTFHGNCYAYDGAFPDGTTGLNGAIELSFAFLNCESITPSMTQTVAQPAIQTGLLALGAALQASASGSAPSSQTPFGDVVLTPGTWAVTADEVYTAGGSGATFQWYNACISTSSSSCSPGFSNAQSATASWASQVVGISNVFTQHVGVFYVTVPPGSPVTYYNVVNSNVTVGAATLVGRIAAQRIY